MFVYLFFNFSTYKHLDLIIGFFTLIIANFMVYLSCHSVIIHIISKHARLLILFKLLNVFIKYRFDESSNVWNQVESCPDVGKWTYHGKWNQL